VPLKLFQPRKGASPFYRVRGTHLGQYVDRSTKCPDRATALKVLQKWKREIERGEFAERGESTFADAMMQYVNAGGSTRFLKPIADYFGPAHLLRDVTQEMIDKAAREIYPNASGATRNRQVYTPISAVLKRAGMKAPIDRPIGAQGQQRTQWLWPEDAEKLIAAATEVDREFAALIVTLLYTGMRLSEGLSLQVRDIRLDEGFVYLPNSKTGEPRAVHLTPFVIATLSAHPRGLEHKGRVFRFTKGRYLYDLLGRTKRRMGADFDWLGFHALCHTYAVWMRRYGGLDTRGLVGTGRWKDQKSAARYAHVVTTEEARKADLLPTPRVKAV
jgi:integrase